MSEVLKPREPIFPLSQKSVLQVLKRPLADTRTDLQKAMARNSV